MVRLSKYMTDQLKHGVLKMDMLYGGTFVLKNNIILMEQAE